MPLGLKQGETLVSNRTNDAESYQQYLRAKALVRARGLKPLTDAAALLEQVVARDPNYAPAWALLAQAYDLTPKLTRLAGASVDELRRVVDASFPKAEAAARRAIQLDPNLADGYLAAGLVQAAREIAAGRRALFQGARVGPQQPGCSALIQRSACRSGPPEGSPRDEATIAGAGTLRSRVQLEHR